MNSRRPKQGNRRPPKQPELITNPELVFGLVGPIGVDLEPVIEALVKALAEVNYSSDTVHITKLMRLSTIKIKLDDTSYYHKYKSLISYANEFRRMSGSRAAMAALSVLKIRQLRKARTGDMNSPAIGTAYIVRQFKRPEEIALMRRIYGRKFIQVSIYGSPAARRKVIMGKIADFDSSPKKDTDRELQAIELIDIDSNQAEEKDGQRRFRCLSSR